MTRNDIINKYFYWLSDLACGQRFSDYASYEKLLEHLHRVEFTYSFPKDQYRADDGMDLRYRFAIMNGYEDSVNFVTDCLRGPCSMLEMMVALAVRCEECIMDDPDLGNRTGQWFWNMIVSLGLGGMTDVHYEEEEVDYVLEKFFNRRYAPNGRGGLFTIRNSRDDLRTTDIWSQMCWYLGSIT